MPDGIGSTLLGEVAKGFREAFALSPAKTFPSYNVIVEFGLHSAFPLGNSQPLFGKSPTTDQNMALWQEIVHQRNSAIVACCAFGTIGTPFHWFTWQY